MIVLSANLVMVESDAHKSFDLLKGMEGDGRELGGKESAG
jgi:hypothetical protein